MTGLDSYDYIVVGAGISGLAFVDSLLSHSDAGSRWSIGGLIREAIGTTPIRSSACTFPRTCTA